MQYTRFLIAILCFFMGSAMSFAASKPAELPIYTENKLAIMVSPDHPQFIIKLSSNPTTGYSWYLREYDSNVIIPVKHSFQAGTSQLVGAPGYELWTFHIKPAGFIVPQQTIMRFVYARPWNVSEESKQLIFRITTTSAQSVSHSQKSE